MVEVELDEEVVDVSFFFKQKTAYEKRISDWSSDVCSSDLLPERSRCEIHYGGQIVYAVVMWSEYDRMGVRFPYELTHGPLFRALEAARAATPSGPARIFLSQRHTGFGRRGLN